MQEELEQERVRQAIMLFMANNRRHRRVFDKLVQELGMSNSQHRLLMHLHNTDCTPSQTEIAHTFEVSTAAIAVALKKLEKNGYIHRCAAIEDSRYKEISLTEKGEEVVQKTHRMFASADMAMFGDFSAGELETFLVCLEKMKNTLRALETGEKTLPRIKGIHVHEILAGAGKEEA